MKIYKRRTKIYIAPVVPTEPQPPGEFSIRMSNYRPGPNFLDDEANATYYDMDRGSNGDDINPGDDVDLRLRDGIVHVGWIDAGEWLTHNVVVPKTATYRATAGVASNGSGTAQLTYTIGSAVFNFSVPRGSDWNAFFPFQSTNTVTVPAGSYIGRFDAVTSDFNIRDIDFTEV